AGSEDGDANAVALGTGPDDEGRREIRIAGSWLERDTMITKSRILAFVREYACPCARIDVIGIGKGVKDQLAIDLKDAACRVEEYGSRDRAKEPERFKNRKAEGAWFLREQLEKGLVRLPKDPELRKQLLAMRYRIDEQGRIRVVDPPDSPDLHDAVLIALSSR